MVSDRGLFLPLVPTQSKNQAAVTRIVSWVAERGRAWT